MNIDIVRAWKDMDYRESLSEEELAIVPVNPVGLIELADEDLENVAAGIEVLGSYSCTRSKGGGCSCSCVPPQPQ